MYIDRKVGTPYEWLCANAASYPKELAIAIWRDGSIVSSYTWEDLLTEVQRRILGLRGLQVSAGDRVVIALPNDLAFAATFLACSALDAIVVPTSVQVTWRPIEFLDRLGGIVESCDPSLIVTTDESVGTMLRGRKANRSIPVVAESMLAAQPGVADSPEFCGAAGQIALLQFTSGSTRRPRGVMITNAMLASQCQQAAVAYAESRSDRAVSWVPLYHDMGLISAFMRPLFHCYPSVFLAPEEFVRRPLEWLQAIDRCGGTISSAPNFAYDLCVRRITEVEAASLDLRSWRVARNAGEPVQTATLRAFSKLLAPAGFDEGALAPSYGLAEATLTVATAGPGCAPRHLFVDRGELARGRIRERRAEDPEGRWVTSSGVPLEGTDIRIASVDEISEVGQIYVSGPQLAPGYWGSGDATVADGRFVQDTSGATWHVTNDLGFIRDEHLFVLGRLDDTLVIHGRNYFAVDLTEVCRQFSELRPGRVAAFIEEVPNAEDAQSSTEVHVCAEISAGGDDPDAAPSELPRRIQAALAEQIGIFVNKVHLLPRGTLPVTSSGKIRIGEVRRCVGGEILR